MMWCFTCKSLGKETVGVVRYYQILGWAAPLPLCKNHAGEITTFTQGEQS